jgi:hypothetical protein
MLTSFNTVAELQTEGAEVLGIAPGGAVESELGSKPLHIGVRFHVGSLHEPGVMAKVD